MPKYVTPQPLYPNPFFVHKKDGSVRMYINCRALSNSTIKNTFPLPLDELLNCLHGATVVEVNDLKSAHHQKRIARQDIPKISFTDKIWSLRVFIDPIWVNRCTCCAPSTDEQPGTLRLSLPGRSVDVQHERSRTQRTFAFGAGNAERSSTFDDDHFWPRPK
jgi:hypothetical protein